MPAGLQIWDEAGSLILDTSTQVANVVGWFNFPTYPTGTPPTDGQWYVGNMPAGSRFIFHHPIRFNDYAQFAPHLHWDGDFIKWNWPDYADWLRYYDPGTEDATSHQLTNLGGGYVFYGVY